MEHLAFFLRGERKLGLWGKSDCRYTRVRSLLGLLRSNRRRVSKHGPRAWLTEQRTFSRRLFICETVFDYSARLNQIAEIEKRMAAPGFWDNQESAQQSVAELKSVKSNRGTTDRDDQLRGRFTRHDRNGGRG